MNPVTLDLLRRLRLRNLQITGSIRERLDAFIESRWNGLDSWRDADMVRLENEVLPVLIAAERQMVDQTNAFLAATSAAATGAAFRPATPAYAVLTGSAIRGVDPSEYFGRAQMMVNYTLAAGGSLTAAVKAGGDRLRSIATTDLQLAKTRTAAKVGRDPFYRRVLTGAENCALCVIASTQRYRLGDLMPIHPGCDCGVEQIVDANPPQVIDTELLEFTHAEIEKRVGATDRNLFDLALGVEKTTAKGRRVSDFSELIVARPHGELGPVLSWRSDHFRDAAEAAALAN